MYGIPLVLPHPAACSSREPTVCVSVVTFAAPFVSPVVPAVSNAGAAVVGTVVVVVVNVSNVII